MPTSKTTKTSVKMLDPESCEGVVYFLPTPKSPHGADVDPSGEYIVAGGKLYSATKEVKVTVGGCGG